MALSRVENGPRKVSVEEAKHKLNKDVRLYLEQSHGFGALRGCRSREVPLTWTRVFFGAYTRAVSSVLGLFPLPNCDQMRVKLELMELLVAH